MFRQAILGVAGAAALSLSAGAADMYAPASGGLKDVYVPVETWAGLYFGANGGFGWSATGSQNIDVLATSIFGFPTPPTPLAGAGGFLPAIRSADPDGGFGGAQVGYNFQRGAFVFGVEADIQISDISGDKTTTLAATTPAFLSLTADHHAALDWFGTVRGRLGYAWNNVLLYATGGFAYGKVIDEFNANLNITPLSLSIPIAHLGREDIQTGFVLGGGVEFKPHWGFVSSPNWTIKAEYQYIDLGSEKVTGSVLGIVGLTTTEVDHTYHTVRVGLNYYIPTGYEPLK